MTEAAPLGAPPPEVSVVIPTHRRETRLAFALDALATQTLARSRYEVIVVRSEHAEGPFTDAPEGLEVRFLRSPGPGRPARQRNVGWQVARGSLVAFTDDDCRPSPGWLEELLDARPGGGEALIQGPTAPDPDERHLLHGHARSVHIPAASPWYQTCNIAYPRATLERLGGFDERFPHAWGEDTELGLRAREAGVEHAFAERALVWHAVLARPLPAVLGDTLRRDPLPLIAAHPLRRRLLFGGFFIRRTHALLTLALAGLLLARRHPLGAAAALPYLTAEIEPHRRRDPRRLVRELPRIAYHLPVRLAVDLLEAAVTVRSAFRLRFPAL